MGLFNKMNYAQYVICLSLNVQTSLTLFWGSHVGYPNRCDLSGLYTA